MEYNSIFTVNAIIKFASKWKKLEKLILREAVHIQRTEMTYTHSLVDIIC